MYGLRVLGIGEYEDSMRIQMEKTHLYSNPARWWGVGNDVKDKIADVLLAMVSTINERTGVETVR